jgi:hypothetical protein
MGDYIQQNYQNTFIAWELRLKHFLEKGIFKREQRREFERGRKIVEKKRQTSKETPAAMHFL